MNEIHVSPDPAARAPHPEWTLSDARINHIFKDLPEVHVLAIQKHMAEAERAAFAAGYDRGMNDGAAVDTGKAVGPPSDALREHFPVLLRQLDEVRRAVYGTSEDRSSGFATPSVLERLMELAQDQRGYLTDIMGLTKRIAKLDAFAIDSMSRLDALEKADQLSVESHSEARGRTNRLEGGIAIIQAQIADIQAQVREMDPVDERVKTAVDMITGVLDSLQKRVATLEGEDAPGEGEQPPPVTAVCVDAGGGAKWYVCPDGNLTFNLADARRMTRDEAEKAIERLALRGFHGARLVSAP